MNEKNEREKIEEVIRSIERSAVKCNKGYRCRNGGCGNICKAAEFGKSFLMCMEDRPADCEFASDTFGDGTYICYCPLRLYIHRKCRES
ncbi:MAG: hypothetical protein JXJ19_02165 [Elusimicrobia bacterium]|nr:hypothetical protein [Elusimicrobiota bacterium]